MVGMSAPGGYGYGPPPIWWTPPALPYGGVAGDAPLLRHPLSAMDILDGAFMLLKANAHKLLIVVAVFAVPVQLVTAFASRHALGGHSMLSVLNDPSVLRSASQSSGGLSLAASSLLRLLGWVGLALAGGAISRVVGATCVGVDAPASEGVTTALGRGIPLVVAAVLVHILEIAGFFFLVLPGLMVMAASVAVSPAIVIERLGPMAGIRRSWKLMSPRLWPTIGTLLLEPPFMEDPPFIGAHAERAETTSIRPRESVESLNDFMLSS